MVRLNKKCSFCRIFWKQIVPAIADVVVAVVYFMVFFDTAVGIVILSTMCAYVCEYQYLLVVPIVTVYMQCYYRVFYLWIIPHRDEITHTAIIVFLVVMVKLSQWRVKYRRKANELDNKKSSTAVDSFINFETVNKPDVLCAVILYSSIF